jgi:tetratricopeptide (TPR) repeat protein
MEILAPLPKESQPAPIAERIDHYLSNRDGQPVRAYGFPSGHDAGVWANGTLVGKLAGGRIQVDGVTELGYFIKPGFSGTPVFLRESSHTVVGIVRYADRDEDVRSGQMISSSHFPSWILKGTAQENEHLLPAPPEQYSVPKYTLTPRFFGREAEIEQLNAWARSDDPLLIVEAIGGMGKSALAWEWTRAHARDVMQPAGIIWWSFHERGATVESFVRHALAYVTRQDPEALKEMSFRDRQARLIEALERAPYLLVLDNLERILVAYNRIDYAYIRDGKISRENHLRDCTDPRDGDFLRQLLDVCPSKTLITTRLIPRVFDEYIDKTDRIHHIELTGLAPQDARLLIETSGVEKYTDDLLMAFLERIDYNSLLIKIVAGTIKEYRSAPGDFDTWYRQNGQEMTLMGVVGADLRTSILNDAIENLDTTVRQLLCEIAVFSDPVDYNTLSILNPYRPPEPPLPALPPFPRLMESPFSDLQEAHVTDPADRQHREAEWQRVKQEREAILQRHRQSFGESSAYKQGEQLFERALHELEDRGLLQWERESNTYDLHPVVRGYAYGLLQEEERTATFGKILDHFAQIPDVKKRHVYEVGDVYDAIKALQARVLAGEYNYGASYYRTHLSSVLLKLGAYHLIISLLKPLFKDGLDAPPCLENESDQSFIMNDMGIALDAVNRHGDAFQLARLQLDPKFANTRWNVFVAVRLYSRLLRDLNRVVDAFHSLGVAAALIDEQNKGWSLYNYSEFYLHIGDVERAEQFYQEARALPEPHQHPDDWRSRMTRVDIELRLEKGTLTTADLEQALAVIEGHGRKSTLQQLYMAWARFSLREGKLVDAAHYCEEAITLGHQIGLFDTIVEARTLRARISLEQINQAQAKQEVLRVREAVPALQPAVRAVVLADLATLVGKMQNREEAEQYAREAYELAWADGPPYVVARAFETAKHMLTRLGVPLPTLPTNTQPAAVPFEKDLREKYDENNRIAQSSQSSSDQPPVQMSFFRWVHIGCVATFGIEDVDLIEAVARKLSTLSTMSGPLQISRQGEDVPLPPTDQVVAVEHHRFDEIDWKFDEIRVWAKIFSIIFIQSTDAQGEDIFAYVNCRTDRLKPLLDLGAQHQPFNLADSATVIVSGKGRPTQEQRQKIMHDYLFGEHHVNVRIFPPLEEVTS